ncbi:WXG100 family type VII secretion target [Arthrobacter sp. MSA 4-2]|uniref:WXG100 family type VII secretion target n=1 Tax=Arthrobacter sp. MSA 4-2 TaxID=2794349 RepID=UPI0018E88C9A|nr:WXG100 family type VII secretion target [Arthrobacter sp. MSA 4-2]MBJ2122262.1 WXG100 family type VII secretion target [Arthrobacter sp. MSA 4-2]
MAHFNVDTDSLAARSAQVQGTIGRLQSEVDSMQAGLRELEALWTGQAASNFQALVAQWRGTQARVEESLAAINEALAAAGRHYAEAELNNARMFLP